MSDIYAEFGVNSAVMSSSDPAEHEQNMLALDVRARDGDASIELSKSDEGDEPDPREGDEPDPKEDDEPDPKEGDEPDQQEGDEIAPLGEPDSALKEASESITRYAEGFAAMKEQAVKAGLTPEAAAQAEQEYEADGKLSSATYEALAKAGYSKGFIDSYIQGQEAVADQFVSRVVEYAGGTEKFQRIIKHMESTSPESVESLYEAVERQDLKSIRTIINLGIQGQTKKFGKAPERSVTKKAPAVAPKAAPKAEGYTSRAEMVKDMSSAAYRNDPAFRAKVEAKVANAKF
jgi:hypothetical protein